MLPELKPAAEEKDSAARPAIAFSTSHFAG
jgi:hypothetical protein